MILNNYFFQYNSTVRILFNDHTLLHVKFC